MQLNSAVETDPSPNTGSVRNCVSKPKLISEI